MVRLVADQLPPGAVIMATADSRIPNQSREPVAIYFSEPELFFVGPNIGITTLLSDRWSPTIAVKLDCPGWTASQFMGRDLYAPTSGRLVSGERLQELGVAFPLDNIRRLAIPNLVVLHIDNYGNVKLNHSEPLPLGSKVLVNGVQATVAKNFQTAPGVIVQEGELIFATGSSFGMSEIQVKCAGPRAVGAAERLSLHIGDVVSLEIL